MAKEVVSEVSTLASDKGLTVSADMPEEPVRAAVDEDSFRRMLLILLDNAIKYTSEGGSITLRVRQYETEVEIEVTDTGRRHSAEDVPSSSIVFGCRQSAFSERGRHRFGAGDCGREIADSHDAELTVRSSARRGSIFTVRLRREVENG